MACSDVYEITVQADQIEVNNDIPSNSGVDSLIAPYRTQMSSTMDEVIAYSANDFTASRPNGSLNNWSADAILTTELGNHSSDSISNAIMCMLNVGGLRNPLSEGSITIGDIYKLMPFDNEIVWVQLPWSAREDIVTYMKNSGGEPIAGAHIHGDSLSFDLTDLEHETFWVITSDYLMNGGDKMRFFEKKINWHYSGTLMRDAMIEYAQSSDTLLYTDETRIILE